jgi:hypothetical protein
MSSQPDRPFQDPREALKVRLASIVQGVEAAAPTDRVVYRVAGGPPGKRLETVIDISGTGKLTASSLDEMAGLSRRRRTSKLARSEVSTLVRSILESGLLDESETGERFLPDSVIASITVETDGAIVTKYFLADARLRSAQGRKLSPALKQLQPLLERLSRRALSTKTSIDERG